MIRRHSPKAKHRTFYSYYPDLNDPWTLNQNMSARMDLIFEEICGKEIWRKAGCMTPIDTDIINVIRSKVKEGIGKLVPSAYSDNY